MAQINLRALPSLKDYTNTELKLLGSVAPARDFREGLYLCREGQVGQSCFLLATGAVQITKTIDGHEKPLATLRAGAIVGQMALVDRSPRSASVRAIEDTVALELTRDVFEGLLRASSLLALRFQEQIAIAGIRQLRMANQRLDQILRQQAEKRVAAEVAQAQRHKLLTVQAALEEWDMTLDELDRVQVSLPAGQVSAAEIAARTRG